MVVRRSPVLAALALLLLALHAGATRASAATILVVDGHGRVRAQQDRFLPPPSPAEAPSHWRAPAPAGSSSRPGAGEPRAASSRKRRKRTVAGELRRLRRAKAISAADERRYAAVHARARRDARRLKGSRRRELRAVIANVDALAAARRLTPSRLPVAFETLRRNAQWWRSGKGVLAYGQRLRFAGSRLVWQAYPGQGVQIQWLGTLGRMNELYLADRRGYDAPLGAMADEVLRYASDRAGGIAWEYQFRFGGGRPPWISSISQGTALQALARAGERLRRPELFAHAHEALGAFRAAPPSGLRVRVAAGSQYAGYSYAPGTLIYNMFFQSLIGLHDFAQIAGDGAARRLWLDGEREARVAVRRADSGSWSYYRPGKLSDAGYHELLRDFVRGLCTRMLDDRDREEAALRERTGDPDAVLEDFESWPDPAPYCETWQAFNRYLKERSSARG